MGKKHKTKEEKQVLINNYLESGLSKAAWCRKNNIAISTFNGCGEEFNKGNKEEIIFVSPKPSKAIKKEKTRSSVSKDKTCDKEVVEFTTILEVEDCKLHINETTPFSFISKLVKAVRESHV